MTKQAKFVSEPLTERQREFLKRVEALEESIPTLRERMGIDMRELAEWLMNEKFRRELSVLRSAMRKLHAVQVEHNGAKATKELSLAAWGMMKDAKEMLTWRMKLLLSLQDRCSVEARQRARRQVQDHVTRTFAHPDIQHMSEQLLDELEEARRETECVGPD